MAALAMRTDRIRTRGQRRLRAPTRNPVLRARLAADLDNLSNGRLILGLGIGWDENEFNNLGIPFPSVPERQAALDEAIAIMRGAWGPEPLSFKGRHFRTRDVLIRPAPRQQPGPPILIAGGGERVTLRQVAECGDSGGRRLSGDTGPDMIESRIPEVALPHVGHDVLAVVEVGSGYGDGAAQDVEDRAAGVDFGDQLGDDLEERPGCRPRP